MEVWVCKPISLCNTATAGLCGELKTKNMKAFAPI